MIIPLLLAKWKAAVLPEGTTATATVKKGDVDIEPSSGIKNDDEITVTGNSKGKYVIELSHDDLPSCAKTGEGIVFEFLGDENNGTVNITEDYAWKDFDLPANRKGPPKYYIPLAYNKYSLRPPLFNYESYAKGIYFLAYGAEFTFTHIQKFGIKTNPPNAYNGSVSAGITTIYKGRMASTSNATAGHHIKIVATGYEHKKNYKSAGSRFNINDTKNGDALFTCGTLDGIVETVAAHLCAQSPSEVSRAQSRLRYEIEFNKYTIK